MNFLAVALAMLARFPGLALAMLARFPGLALAMLALGGCASESRYLVGEPYRMGGVWSYPREQSRYGETGLAARVGSSFFGRTANGERHDASRATAQHRTLQLPAVLRVTNLENGRSMLVRANDRGPEQPGRLIGLSARAADLLGMAAGTAVQVRVELDAGASGAVAASAPGRPDPAGPIAAAPRAAVASEELAPPPGARAGVVQTASAPRPSPAAEAARSTDIAIPEDVTTGPATPGRLLIEAGSFHSRPPAARQAARLAALGARVETVRGESEAVFRVRIGPFTETQAADSALERTATLGVSGARILVE